MDSDMQSARNLPLPGAEIVTPCPCAISNYTELTALLWLSFREKTATKGQYTQAAVVTSIN